jgi:hypothetical protein
VALLTLPQAGATLALMLIRGASVFGRAGSSRGVQLGSASALRSLAPLLRGGGVRGRCRKFAEAGVRGESPLTRRYAPTSPRKQAGRG